MSHRDGLDAGERGLRCGLCRADDALQAGEERTLGDGERSGDRPDPPVERELADRGVLRQPFRRELPCRGEHGERDREIESRSLLAQGCGREVDRDPPVERPLERGGYDAAADAMLRLLARAVSETDDREAGHTELEMRLDLDLARLESDERVGDRASEHPLEGRAGGPAPSRDLEPRVLRLLRDEDRLEVLTGTPPGAAVHVALEAIDEPEPGAVEYLCVEVAAVVHDDDHRRLRSQRLRAAREDTRYPGHVLLDRGLA